MEILMSEIIDSSMPLYAFIILVVATLIVCLNTIERIHMKFIFSSLIILIWLNLYLYYKEDIWEHAIIKVTDWNEFKKSDWIIVEEHENILMTKRKIK